MIIIEPCAGLGNRLLALTSAYELAEKLGRELLVIWKSEIGCQIRSEELFLFDGVKVINISESGWKQDFAGTLRGNAVKKKYRGSADRFVECDEVEVWKKEGGFARVEQEIAKTSRIYIKSYTNLCEITPDSFRFLNAFRCGGSAWQRSVCPDHKGTDGGGDTIRRTDPHRRSQTARWSCLPIG